MNKYTINKAFTKEFPHPIWKIEVDADNKCLAVECRDSESTMPTFFVVDFQGYEQGMPFQVEEKEWTLEAIQNGHLILKRFGDASPIAPGIKIHDYRRDKEVLTAMEYVLLDVFLGYVLARHRNISSGRQEYIQIATGNISSSHNYTAPQTVNAQVQYPFIYPGKLPAFMASIDHVDDFWLLPFENYFLWSYQQRIRDKIDLHIVLTTKSQLIEDLTVLNALDKLIPQPFFVVKGHIFFLSNTKREIVTYLV